MRKIKYLNNYVNKKLNVKLKEIIGKNVRNELYVEQNELKEKMKELEEKEKKQKQKEELLANAIEQMKYKEQKKKNKKWKLNLKGN